MDENLAEMLMMNTFPIAMIALPTITHMILDPINSLINDPTITNTQLIETPNFIGYISRM